ncbi:hypothetical protein ABL78_4536 [Leptomonas seymouri]|uniref:Uncharacterized protein n=1 Tax=Leptomonas seymouri TaxID=5684 RepID=A0A0N1I689_LEPSE|nr:hypothetical protein ABL78_4536 [Leptomonas seymouri]|eukprot:KPI86385.1 hypothetical protein ABL78_4536 [Leptomonas seymouri]
MELEGIVTGRNDTDVPCGALSPQLDSRGGFPAQPLPTSPQLGTPVQLRDGHGSSLWTAGVAVPFAFMCACATHVLRWMSVGLRDTPIA